MMFLLMVGSTLIQALKLSFLTDPKFLNGDKEVINIWGCSYCTAHTGCSTVRAVGQGFW